MAEKNWLSTRARNLGDHVTVHPSMSTHLFAPQENQCEISHFPASVHGSLQPDIAHLCCGQLIAVKTVYPQTSIT